MSKESIVINRGDYHITDRNSTIPLTIQGMGDAIAIIVDSPQGKTALGYGLTPASLQKMLFEIAPNKEDALQITFIGGNASSLPDTEKMMQLLEDFKDYNLNITKVQESGRVDSFTYTPDTQEIKPAIFSYTHLIQSAPTPSSWGKGGPN